MTTNNDIYTKEELWKYLLEDDVKGSNEHFKKLHKTITNKMLDDDKNNYSFNDDEINRLASNKKTEGITFFLNVAENINIEFKAGQIKKIENAFIHTTNPEFSFHKKRYAEKIIFLFLTNHKTLKIVQDYGNLNTDDSLNILNSYKDFMTLRNIFIARNNMDIDNLKYVLNKLDFDENTKQAHLYTIVSDLIEIPSSKKEIIGCIFDYVEDKDKLLKSVNAVLGQQKYKNQKIKQEEYFSLLEKYYLESKTQKTNDLNIELPKKRL